MKTYYIKMFFIYIYIYTCIIIIMFSFTSIEVSRILSKYALTHNFIKLQNFNKFDKILLISIYVFINLCIYMRIYIYIS